MQGPAGPTGPTGPQGPAGPGGAVRGWVHSSDGKLFDGTAAVINILDGIPAGSYIITATVDTRSNLIPASGETASIVLRCALNANPLELATASESATGFEGDQAYASLAMTAALTVNEARRPYVFCSAAGANSYGSTNTAVNYYSRITVVQVDSVQFS
jgi:hypothetical protein